MTRRPGRPALMSLLARLGASGAVVLLHLLLCSEDYTAWQGLLASMPAVVVVNVAWPLMAGRGKPVLPVLIWVLVQLDVFFAMPVLSEGRDQSLLQWSYLQRLGAVTQALLASVVLVGFFLCTWFITAPRKRPPGDEQNVRSSRPLPTIVLAAYGGITIAVTFALRVYGWEFRAAWFAYLVGLTFAPVTALALICFEWQRAPRNGAVHRLLIIMTVAASMAGLLIGRLNFALTPFLVYTIARVAREGKVPRRLILVVLVGVLLFNPAKLLYREALGYRTDEFADVTMEDRLGTWVDSLSAIWLGDAAGREKGLKATASRLNMLTLNADVVAQVPGRVPYAMGDPWAAVAYSLVPRLLWRDKPLITDITNDRFSITFGFITAEGAERTTKAYPAVADGYWNFGWLGVALVGCIYGLFWSSILRLWSMTSRFRYVLAMVVLVSVPAMVSVPNLLIGRVQEVVMVGAIVLATEALARLITGRGARMGGAGV